MKLIKTDLKIKQAGFTAIILAGTILSFFSLCTRVHANMNTDPSLKVNQGFILIAAPGVDNLYYKDIFKDILEFDGHFQKQEGVEDKVFVMCNNETIKYLEAYVPKDRIIQMPYDDIWMRDLGPVVTKRLVKFKYSPSYFDKDDAKYYDRQFKTFLDSFEFKYHKSNLILDGGNAIWNGAETVILTDRVLSDNSVYSSKKIIELLKKDLMVSNIILIPEEDGDVLAHADGMVKFITKKSIILSDFNGNDSFREKVENKILLKMPDAEFVIIPSSYARRQYDSKIASAKGVYVNILETDQNVYIPQYGLELDKNVFDMIADNFNKQAIAVDVETVSIMGGAVNCLTWYCPYHLLPDSFKKK